MGHGGGMHDKIKCTWNFTVLPEIKIKNVNVDDFEALVIPGGFEEAGFFIDAYSNSFLDLIRTFNAKGKIIASVCVGALSIGKSGILKGRTATTYNLNDRKRQYELSKFGVKILENQPIVIDKNVITSYNPSTAFNVAFTLLEMLTSTENCTKVKKLMGFI